MPLTVRNLSSTHVVLSHLAKDVPSVEWKPKGDRDGEDIQQVPDSITESSVSFLKAVGLGILQVETDNQALLSSIEQQAQRYRRSQDAAQTELQSVLDTSAASGVIRITEDQIDRHIDALTKAQPSDLSTIGEPA